MAWNTINTEWDPDQETVNFGTRQFVVVDSALYDVVTLATVESQEIVSSSRNISAKFYFQISKVYMNIVLLRLSNQSPRSAAVSLTITWSLLWITFCTFWEKMAKPYLTVSP